jgi:hypothetical protein
VVMAMTRFRWRTVERVFVRTIPPALRPHHRSSFDVCLQWLLGSLLVTRDGEGRVGYHSVSA